MLVIAVLGNRMMKDSIDDVIHKKAVKTSFDISLFNGFVKVVFVNRYSIRAFLPQQSPL